MPLWKAKMSGSTYHCIPTSLDKKECHRFNPVGTGFQRQNVDSEDLGKDILRGI